MSRVDWQAAWLELGSLIASKSHHGGAELSRSMNEIAARHRVPETREQRDLRVHGPGVVEELVDVVHELRGSEPSARAASSGDGAALESRPPIRPQGGHDGRKRSSSQHPPERAGSPA